MIEVSSASTFHLILCSLHFPIPLPSHLVIPSPVPVWSPPYLSHEFGGYQILDYGCHHAWFCCLMTVTSYLHLSSTSLAYHFNHYSPLFCLCACLLCSLFWAALAQWFGLLLWCFHSQLNTSAITPLPRFPLYLLSSVFCLRISASAPIQQFPLLHKHKQRVLQTNGDAISESQKLYPSWETSAES